MIEVYARSGRWSRHCARQSLTHDAHVSNKSKPRRGFSAIPFFGDLVALFRMVRDREVGFGMKALAAATLIYVVSPIDAFPEALAPFIAWVDDVGLVLMLRALLSDRLTPYRYPLFEAPGKTEQPMKNAELQSSTTSVIERG
jgi:uncharacterized membrane protein YkvA (DUF1232 family)